MTRPLGRRRSELGPAAHSDRCGDRCGHDDVPAGVIGRFGDIEKIMRRVGGGPVRAAIQAQDKDPCMAHEILLRQSDIWKRNRLRSWLAWRQADHYVTRPKRSSRLFPRRVFHLAGDPTEGRLCACSCDDEHTIASSPDLCKSGAQIMKKHIFSMNYAQRNKHIGLNGVSPYSTDRALLTEK